MVFGGPVESTGVALCVREGVVWGVEAMWEVVFGYGVQQPLEPV